MTTKVKKTETYKDSQGEHIVCKGKLILIPNEKYDMPTMYIKDKGHFTPIIISEIEEIKAKEKYLAYFGTVTEILIASERISAGKHRCFKVLALPEHFSPKHLQAIIDGKLKDGDEVYVECEKIDWDADIISGYMGPNWVNIIKLTNNHIKLFPVKKEEIMYSFREMIDFVKWYSGMEQHKVVNAWNRYVDEVRLKP